MCYLIHAAGSFVVAHAPDNGETRCATIKVHARHQLGVVMLWKCREIHHTVLLKGLKQFRGRDLTHIGGIAFELNLIACRPCVLCDKAHTKRGHKVSSAVQSIHLVHDILSTRKPGFAALLVASLVIHYKELYPEWLGLVRIVKQHASPIHFLFRLFWHVEKRMQ
jgi:hypothetical protein